MLITAYSKLTYINSADEKLEFLPKSAFWVEKVQEQIGNQVHGQKQVATHGKYFTGMSLDERYIVLTGSVSQRMDTITAQSTLQRVFNPTLSGKLIYENSKHEIKREIECRIEELPTTYWSQAALRFDINLVCLDPFWKGESITEFIALLTKEFKFKLAIPKTGMTFGRKREALESEFENAGNVESGFKAVIRAAKGKVLNPMIKNINTNEIIKINYEMQQYDEIEIISTLQEKRILINGENGFKYLDVAVSTFFEIQVGSNTIGYNADENISNMTVSVEYIPSYTHAEVF